MNNRFLAACCFCTLAIAAPLQTLSANQNVFVSTDHGFRFQYPETWISKPPRANPDAKAKVSSNLPDKANCYVEVKRIVNGPDLATGITSSQQLLAEVRKDFPEVRLIEAGPTSVAGAPANYIIVEMSYWSYDSTITIRNLAVRARNDGETFTLTCGAFENWFERYEPVFWDIVGSFEFTDGGQPATNRIQN